MRKRIGLKPGLHLAGRTRVPAPASGDRARSRGKRSSLSPRPAGRARFSESIPPSAPTVGQPITGAADPRWVLAIRVCEEMEGAVMPPAKREKLIRLGKLLGLTPFDANLIIAIMQDRARRGHRSTECLAAGQEQLAMIALPDGRKGTRGRRLLATVGALAALLALEMMLIALLM